MVDVNPFELHPEEVAKVDNYSEDFKRFVRVSEKNMLGMMADNESVIGKMAKIKLNPEAKDDSKVNHPKHYNTYKGIEIIDLAEQMNFNRGNAVKYIARAGIKDQSTEIEDLEKAEFYIRREIDRLKEEDSDV